MDEKNIKWSTQCPDWETRLINGESIIPPPIFPERAEEALAVFKELKIVDAPGSPTFGESCAQWVFELVASIFGAYDESTHSRLITEWFILVPKKNSKSTVAAGIMMTALILNWRLSASYNILAPTIEVAGNSFNPARDMAQHDEDLDALMQVQTHIKTITHRDSNATLKVLAADQNTVGGTKAVGTLVDELHLFGKMQGAENMFREATGGLASRQEGFVVWLTTQSDEPPAGIFRQKLKYARDVRDGVIVDPGFVPVIFEHPNSMVAKNEHMLLKNLPLVNPNLGYSVDKKFLEREFRKAEFEGQSAMIAFMAKHGNVEVGMNLRSDRWSGADFWSGTADETIDLQYIIDNSDVIEIGIDGGGLDDMLGLAVIGRHKDNGDWLLWNRVWIFTQAIRERKQNATRYEDFNADGDLIIVRLESHRGDDGKIYFNEEESRSAWDKVMSGIIEIVESCDESGLLDKIGVDRHGLGMIVDYLEKVFDVSRIVGVPQGWQLTSAIKTVALKVATFTMRHAGQPIMAWCVGNAKQEQKGNAVSITKQSSGTCKIDPLIAVFCAAEIMSKNPESRNGMNIYEKYSLVRG